MALSDIVNAAVLVKAEVEKLNALKQDFATNRDRAQSLQDQVVAQQTIVDNAVAALKGWL